MIQCKSLVMQKMYQMIDRIAPTMHPILITGPTGVGKEVITNYVHSKSLQPQSPLIDVNCGAIPDAIIESQLFGHKKGAFTGAIADHDGFFSITKDGTLFLDEIGELPLSQQSKLLRILETRQFRPIGSHENFLFNGRVVAATHANLEDMVAQKTFREDLFFRLNVFHLKIPSLNERREDIPKLVADLLNRGGYSIHFTSEAMELLMWADWSGNIRQLKNTIDKIAILSDDPKITKEIAQPYIISKATSSSQEIKTIVHDILRLDVKNKLSAIEYSMIDQALIASDGNKSKAADLLGIHRKSIERRLKNMTLSKKDILHFYQEGIALVESSQYKEAASLFRQAMEVIEKQPPSEELDEIRLNVLVQLGSCIRKHSGWDDHELIAINDSAVTIGERLQIKPDSTGADFDLWVKHLLHLELDKALDIAQKSIEVGQCQGDIHTLSQGYISLANTYFWHGDYDAVMDGLNHFAHLHQEKDEDYLSYRHDPFVFYLMLLALTSLQKGFINRTQVIITEIFNYVDMTNDPFNLAIALHVGAWIEYLLGNLKSSYLYAERLVSLSKEHDFLFYHGFGMIFEGSWIAIGDMEDGLIRINKGYHTKFHKNGGSVFNSMYGLVIGEIYYVHKQGKEGLHFLEDIIGLAKEKKEFVYYSELLTLEGKLYIIQNQYHHAESSLTEALSLAQKMGSLTAELKASYVLAQVLVELDQKESAIKILRSIILKFLGEPDFQILQEAKMLLKNMTDTL